jgi:hypothetical protein
MRDLFCLIVLGSVDSGPMSNQNITVVAVAEATHLMAERKQAKNRKGSRTKYCPQRQPQ